MSNDSTTAASETHSSAMSAPPIATWASPAELTELDDSVNRYFQLAELLRNADDEFAIEPQLASVISAGLISFRILRGLNLRWRDEVNAGRVALEWDNLRAISTRYRRWFATSRLVLAENRRFIKGTDAAARAANARLLHDACLEAMTPANINVDDLRAAYERVDSQNKSWDNRPPMTGRGA